MELNPIEDFNEIRKMIGGSPHPHAKDKICKYLNAEMINFVSKSKLFMLATIDEHGFPTISPKGEKAGQVVVEDKNRIIIPERIGNRLAFSIQNILMNKKIALIFIVPGTNETLRVHGECVISYDREMCAKLTKNGDKALLLMVVDVKTAYFHCPKSMVRGDVWHPENWPDKILPTSGGKLYEVYTILKGLIKTLFY